MSTTHATATHGDRIVKAGVNEVLTYSVQQQGTATGRECRTILVGEATGRFYCAHEGCAYTAPKWSSVFAHRSSHAKAATMAAAELEAALDLKLARTLTENTRLRKRLDTETTRRKELEKQLRHARRQDVARRQALA